MQTSISVTLFLILQLMSHSVFAEFPEALQKRYAPATIEPYSIYLTAPKIAEERSQVNIRINYPLYMANQAKVTEISFYSHLKPATPLMSYQLGKNTMADGLKARLKLATGNNIIYAVAKLSDGRVVGGETLTKAIRLCDGGG